jgi:hypothetical protein
MKYESRITYHSKDMANVKVFYRQTDRPKTICPRSFDTGHKKEIKKIVHVWNSYIYLHTYISSNYEQSCIITSLRNAICPIHLVTVTITNDKYMYVVLRILEVQLLRMIIEKFGFDYFCLSRNINHVRCKINFARHQMRWI